MRRHQGQSGPLLHFLLVADHAAAGAADQRVAGQSFLHGLQLLRKILQVMRRSKDQAQVGGLFRKPAVKAVQNLFDRRLGPHLARHGAGKLHDNAPPLGPYACVCHRWVLA